MADVPPSPVAWEDHARDIAKLNSAGALNIIKEILPLTPRTNFHFALGRIMERLREETDVLVAAEKITVSQLAWADRNIMELRIRLRYVCKSEANTERFVNDIVTNTALTMRALLRMVDDLADKVENPIRPTPDQHRTAAHMEGARTEPGIADEGPLMARTCAKNVGLEKEYLALSTVTSPLIHPSAISILRTFDMEVYRQPLQGFGLMNGSELVIDVRKHIEVNGFNAAKTV